MIPGLTEMEVSAVSNPSTTPDPNVRLDVGGWISGPCAPTDPPVTWGLIIDVLSALEEHGWHQDGDDRHTGRAILLIGQLARVYTGTEPS